MPGLQGVPTAPVAPAPAGAPRREVSRGRILWVNWRDLRNPLAGGAEVHAHEVLSRLAARGWDCTLVSHAVPDLPERETESGYTILREGGASTFNFTVWSQLPSWIAKSRAQIVVDDSNKIAFLAPWRTKVPVVALIHHLFGKAIFREASLPAALYVNLAERLVPRCYRDTPTMTGSPSARAELMGLGLRDVVDVGEGVDLSGYAPPAAGERDPDLLLYLGRIKKYKGLDALLHTVAALAPRHPGVRLEVAGSGDDVPRLQDLARTLGISERVRFLGRVSEEEKISLYRRASVALNSLPQGRLGPDQHRGQRMRNARGRFRRPRTVRFRARRRDGLPRAVRRPRCHGPSGWDGSCRNRRWPRACTRPAWPGPLPTPGDRVADRTEEVLLRRLASK
jgi:glycosyltransferase involved in cell wall biosynthesis